MSNSILEGLIKEKDYTFKKLLFKLIKDFDLTLEELLLLIYFINQDNLEITASTKTLNNIPEEIIKKLASIGKDLEQKYGCDVDIEWACENNIIYIIQCRPITT